MDHNQTGILFIGYFLSKHAYGRCVCEDLSVRFQEHGYRVITTSDSTNRYLRLLDIVATIIRRRNDYQVASVEIYNGLAFIWAEIACKLLRFLKKPYVITLHGARMLQFSQRWPGRVRRLLQEADQVTTPSKLFQEKFSHWRSDIIYLPNAIDVDMYPYQHRNKPKPRLGWLRKFERNYNPTLAVETLALLLKDFPSIKLIMSGADPHDGSSDEVKKLIHKYGITNELEITGFITRSRIPDWFSQSDIYINTTKVESFGIAVMEAAAAGLCIITTDVGELAYLWQDDEEALLIPSDNPDAMAAAVRRILTEPELAAHLSANARTKAENYDWSVILPQWEMVFGQLKRNV
jgi:glycosyltransferase involved in cell wall biosynthesis